MRIQNNRRISICQFSTYKWTFNQDVLRYATYGFDSIGIWRRKLDDMDKAEAIDCVYNSKLSVSSIQWAGGFTGDGSNFADAIEDAIEAIELASQVGADCLILHPGSRNGHTTSHALRLFHSALDELVPIASDFGVKLALEPTLGQDAGVWTFFDSFQQSMETLDRYSPRHLGVVLDLFQIGFDSEIFNSLNEIKKRISLVQLADRKRDAEVAERLPLGEGDLPIEKWLRKLHQIGYSGKFEIELHGGAFKGRDYFDLLDQTDEYLRDPAIDNLISTTTTEAENPVASRSNQTD